MKHWLVLLLSLVLAGCATVATTPPPAVFLTDSFFNAPSQRVSAADIFTG